MENILVCHYSFFKLSTVGHDKYYQILEEDNEVVQFFKEHGATRWVTFGKANERLITHHYSMMKFAERIGAEDKILAIGRNGQNFIQIIIGSRILVDYFLLTCWQQSMKLI